MSSNPICWTTKSISLQTIKETDSAKKEAKIIKGFMFNEVPTTPLHTSNFLPEWQHSQEGGRDQNDTLNILTNLDQNSPPGKKNANMIFKVKKQQNNLMDVK